MKKRINLNYWHIVIADPSPAHRSETQLRKSIECSSWTRVCTLYLNLHICSNDSLRTRLALIHSSIHSFIHGRNKTCMRILWYWTIFTRWWTKYKLYTFKFIVFFFSLHKNTFFYYLSRYSINSNFIWDLAKSWLSLAYQ